MRSLFDKRSDFVMGMSLAELFLLLLFCFMLVVNARSEHEPANLSSLNRTALVALLERTQAEQAALADTIKALQKELARSRDVIAYLREWTGAPEVTVPLVQRTLERKILEGKRGAPACADINTLLQVQSSNGTRTVRLLTVDEELAQALTAAGLQLTANQLLGPAELDLFLRTTLQFENAQGCRYDYSFTYATAEDYQWCREHFERYFYPAGLGRRSLP
jgi:hypothetical protein